MSKPKPVAAFDIDGTIFRSSLLIEVTEALVKIGVFDADVHRVYEKEYQEWMDRAGSYDDYIRQVIVAFEQAIKGVDQQTLDVISAIVIKRMAHQTYRFTRDLLKELRKTHYLLAISGSPIHVVGHFATAYGFDSFYATELKLRKNIFTGKSKPTVGAKADLLKKCVKQNNLTFEGSVGVGDSEGDIDFLRLVERPIAFNPNSVLLHEARKNAWQIVVERKDVIYRMARHDIL